MAINHKNINPSALSKRSKLNLNKVIGSILLDKFNEIIRIP